MIGAALDLTLQQVRRLPISPPKPKARSTAPGFAVGPGDRNEWCSRYSECGTVFLRRGGGTDGHCPVDCPVDCKAFERENFEPAMGGLN